MEIIKTVNEEGTELALVGRLDTTTAPELNKELTTLFAEGVNHLVLDFKELEYISSAGLRELLFAQKNIGSEGTFVIRNVNEVIMEILEITGFTDILTIE
ncbi:MAG: STAS domain-containing protein [Erysipelotrichaceae bacterium]|nr:STAS domain-containing protein [Erysipelotrichaceae bacterium]